MIRFLQTADLHFDRAFEGVKPTEELFAEKILHANEKTLAKIVKVAIKNQVDFMIIAGDTFHQSFSSLNIQKILIDNFNILAENEIPVFMIFGNHDYYDAKRFWFSFPENVFLFTTEDVETKIFTTKNEEKVAISAFSYNHQWIKETKAVDFPQRDAKVDYHLGIYHGEKGKSGNYAPFSVTDLQSKNYDYWALGHVHLPDVLDQEQRIRYSGAPIGHTRKERNSRSVNLVELSQNDLKVEQINVAALEFSAIVCDVQEITDLEKLRECIQSKLSKFSKGDVQQFVEIELVNVAKELVPNLDETELIEFFNSLYPLELSISKISWQMLAKKQEKNVIPFTKAEITEHFADFEKRGLICELAKNLTRKRGLTDFLTIDEKDFGQEIYDLAKEHFYESFELKSN